METARVAVSSLPREWGLSIAFPVRTLCEHTFVAWKPPDRWSYAHLLGIYLGDGCISGTGRTYQLRVHLDAAYEEIVDECRVSMQLAFPTSRVITRTRPGVQIRIVEVNTKLLPDAFPQHGPGRKHERPIVLAPWQRAIVEEFPGQFVRGLIQSDGSRCINRFTTRLPSGRVAEYAYPRYFFSNLSPDIRELFREACGLLGVRVTRSSHRNLSVAHRKSVAILDEHVGPKS